jgi:hypothetical protein
LVRKPEGKGVLERSTYRWKYNIKIDLEVIGQKGVDLILLAQVQMVGLCEDDNEPLVPYTVQYFLTGGETVSFLRDLFLWFRSRCL